MTNRPFLFASGLLFAGLILVYSNHFQNGFHFDDSHAIVNNVYIRSLHNIPLFFKDATTISSLPANQSYRPMLSVSYAFDYWIGNGLNTFYFHLSTFIWYLLQCILMFFILKKLLDKIKIMPGNRWIALFTVSYYGYHTANAETINYISARSDSVSTFWLIVAFWIFIFFPRLRLRGMGIYLLPLIISVLYKPATLVFPGLLFFYLLFFESDFICSKCFSKKNLLCVFKSLLLSLPSLIVCIALYILQAKKTPATFVPSTTSQIDYIITQPFVFLHYFKNFFFPNDLSADTDWTTLTTIVHWKFFVGIVFLSFMLWISWFFARKKDTQGVAFGILWFFIALLPSSSMIPFAEVMNDHRTFFPYVGLVFSLGFLVQIFFAVKFQRTPALLLIVLFILSAHAYGTVQRNKVWRTDESLWKDVTEKSPGNARGHMNYGIALMARGRYDEAEKYFHNTLSLWPYYDYGFINMGILKNAKGNSQEAERYFKKAIEYGPMNPESYYYYAEFLNSKKRSEEAILLLKKAIEISPGHTHVRLLLMNIYANEYKWNALRKLAEETLKILPQDRNANYFLEVSKTRKTKKEMAIELVEKSPTPDNYLNLSFISYQENDFRSCIFYAKRAIEIKADYAEAFNNIGSAYNMMALFDSAEIALEKAIQINSSYELAKNNLLLARKRKSEVKEFLDAINAHPSEEGYLSLSLYFYNQGMYAKCIEAAESALKINPFSPNAYNTICSAYNNLKMWDKAIAACSQALRYQPDFQLAKNNLAFALERKESSQ